MYGENDLLSNMQLPNNIHVCIYQRNCFFKLTSPFFLLDVTNFILISLAKVKRADLEDHSGDILNSLIRGVQTHLESPFHNTRVAGMVLHIIYRSVIYLSIYQSSNYLVFFVC